ncbi:MAG: sensor histidine kinase, partial [Acidobacteriota bacterium]
NISMALEDLPTDGFIAGLLSDAEKATFRARDLIRKFITFAPGGSLYKKPVSAREVMEEAARLALTGSAIECRYDFAEDLHPIDADPDLIGKAFYNLIVNAREAMYDAGAIRIEAENADFEDRRTEPFLQDGGPYVRISIRDQGAGIRSENLDRIFDPYFSTKDRGSQKGMGLGLAIAYSIIRKHKGFISVESQVGTGTVFNIYIPSCEPLH